MAESTKELRRRITGVTNIQKITRAMEMVATTRLRRLQARAEGSRPYADAIRRLSSDVGAVVPADASPLTGARPDVRRVAVLVLSSDRGLCGSYNTNVFRRARQLLKEQREAPQGTRDVELYLFGKQARRAFAGRPEVKQAYPDFVEKLDYRRAREVARELAEAFLLGGAEGGVDEVWVVYTRFHTMTRQTPTAELLLPIQREEEDGARKASSGVPPLLEPSARTLLRLLLPKSVVVRVYAAMLDSLASEFAARRVAMKAATDAAGDMVVQLQRRYNRARQESITKELLDIVGGAEALK